MQFSFSRTECFEKCKYQFKLRYIEKLRTIPNPSADSPLVVGSALHLGLEEGTTAMESYYCNQYALITDKHINEMIKLTILSEKACDVIRSLVGDRKTQYEYEINLTTFRGFIDFIIHNQDGSIDIYDFKYSNNQDHYLESKQLHLYKYFMEKLGFKVRKIGFIFVSKTYIRQKKTEDLYQFRKRLKTTLNDLEVTVKELIYDKEKVKDFFNNCEAIKKETNYIKSPSRLCAWCEYQKYCEGGQTYMLLPENIKRERKTDTTPDFWIYADSYVGKSTFVDKLDNLLFLNTDGNIDNTVSPFIKIADKVTYEGRLKKVTQAWEVFLDVLTELEKKENTYKRVCIDLVEDLYEHCRLYTYKKLGIDHEQDAGFGKGWDMVRTEFLSAMKRLKSLEYQLIFISKEVMSEITLKNGTKLTTIKPNINDKVANVLAGVVDLTTRAYMDDDKRYLQLEKQENVFGGGRFNFKVPKVSLDMETFIEALEVAQSSDKNEEEVTEQTTKSKSRRSKNNKEDK